MALDTKKLDAALAKAGELTARMDAVVRGRKADELYPVKFAVELSNWEDLRGLIALWRYIRGSANGGHSFNMVADFDDLKEKAPKVFIDGDGADKVGRIFLNGEDVTED